jgi:Fe-S cluster assembly protein SufB
MSKYTEDDLKSNSKIKNTNTDFTRSWKPKPLNEDIVRAISKKGEPQWMTDWRLEAFRAWEQMIEPNGPM